MKLIPMRVKPKVVNLVNLLNMHLVILYHRFLIKMDKISVKIIHPKVKPLKFQAIVIQKI